MAELLTGDKVVASMREALAQRIAALGEGGVVPTLAIVRVGDRADDVIYERMASKRAEILGVKIESFALDAGASTADIARTVQKVNADQAVHGCLLLRPLPQDVDEVRICDLIAPGKDVDGVSRSSLAQVFIGEGRGFPPATAQACLELLDFYNIPVEGRHVVVIGRSLVVGRPLAMLLLHRNATVTICHSKSSNVSSLTREADIVICVAGKACAFGRDYFSSGQTVLDVGTNVDDQGALCGDVDFEDVEPTVEAITPVPGGIGSVTTCVTMAHVVLAAEKMGR